MQIDRNVRDPFKLTDLLFYVRHPDMRGKRIGQQQVAFRNEWLNILRSIVRPLLAAVPTPSPASAVGTGSNSGSADPDVRAVAMIAAQQVAGMPGTTTQQLIEQWRQTVAPEIPITVLLAFIRFESGGNFGDATHGSPRNQPPYTQPDFYELGLFQIPAGLHGSCTTGSYTSCSNPPPGIEKAGDPSPWFLLCKRIGANPQQWQNPVTQVRVGLMNLAEPAARIMKDFPELFHSAGSDWNLRMAVLLPFARGGGYTRAFLNSFRKDLETLPEQSRWGFMRDKTVRAPRGLWIFDPGNVDKKIALATKLGYRPGS
jgi:hypothetical protein